MSPTTAQSGIKRARLIAPIKNSVLRSGFGLREESCKSSLRGVPLAKRETLAQIVGWKTESKKLAGESLKSYFDRLAKNWGVDLRISQRDRIGKFNSQMKNFSLRFSSALVSANKGDLSSLRELSRELSYTMQGIHQQRESMNYPTGLHSKEFWELLQSLDAKKKEVDRFVGQFARKKN